MTDSESPNSHRELGRIRGDPCEEWERGLLILATTTKCAGSSLQHVPGLGLMITCDLKCDCGLRVATGPDMSPGRTEHVPAGSRASLAKSILSWAGPTGYVLATASRSTAFSLPLHLTKKGNHFP